MRIKAGNRIEHAIQTSRTQIIKQSIALDASSDTVSVLDDMIAIRRGKIERIGNMGPAREHILQELLLRVARSQDVRAARTADMRVCTGSNGLARSRGKPVRPADKKLRLGRIDLDSRKIIDETMDVADPTATIQRRRSRAGKIIVFEKPRMRNRKMHARTACQLPDVIDVTNPAPARMHRRILIEAGELSGIEAVDRHVERMAHIARIRDRQLHAADDVIETISPRPIRIHGVMVGKDHKIHAGLLGQGIHALRTQSLIEHIKARKGMHVHIARLPALITEHRSLLLVDDT